MRRFSRFEHDQLLSLGLDVERASENMTTYVFEAKDDMFNKVRPPGYKEAMDKHKADTAGRYYRYGKPKPPDFGYEYDLHDKVTGEPVFRVTKPSWGTKDRKFDLEWHPHMQETHPGLTNTFEHGFGRGKAHTGSAGSGESIGWQAERAYTHAAKKGFKDTLHTDIVRWQPGDVDAYKAKHSTSYNQDKSHEDWAAEVGRAAAEGHVKAVHFKDPDTGEKILTVHNGSDPSAHTTDGHLTWHSSYIKSHGMHPDSWKNIKVGGISGYGKSFSDTRVRPYDQAMEMYGRKSQAQPVAVGTSTRAATVTHFKGAPGISDEDLSAAHEHAITTNSSKLMSDYEHAKRAWGVTRHSPTVFEVSHPDTGSEWDENYHHMSVTKGGIVTHMVAATRPRDDKSSTAKIMPVGWKPES